MGWNIKHIDYGVKKMKKQLKEQEKIQMHLYVVYLDIQLFLEQNQ